LFFFEAKNSFVALKLWGDSVIPGWFPCAARRALKRPANIGESLLKQTQEPFSSGFYLL
jgi:hypothetical protein